MSYTAGGKFMGGFYRKFAGGKFGSMFLVLVVS